MGEGGGGEGCLCVSHGGGGAGCTCEAWGCRVYVCEAVAGWVGCMFVRHDGDGRGCTPTHHHLCVHGVFVCMR